MKKVNIDKTNQQQSNKISYSPMKLTVYGKMVKLTAAGSTGAAESNGNANNMTDPTRRA